MDMAFILSAVNEDGLTETLRPAITGVTGVSSVTLNDNLRDQLADVIAGAEVVDQFGDVLLIVHAEGQVDENAVSVAVNAHNPATPSAGQQEAALWAQVAADADALLASIDWQAELTDINQGIALVQNQIVNGAPTLVQVRASLGLLLIGNGTTVPEGMIHKIEKIGRYILALSRILGKTNDTETT